MKALLEGEYTCRELAQVTDLHYITVLDYCRALHAAGIIYICKWQKDDLGRESIMVYRLAIAATEDVQKKTVTRAEQQRRYRARKKLRGRMDTENRLADAMNRTFNSGLAVVLQPTEDNIGLQMP